MTPLNPVRCHGVLGQAASTVPRICGRREALEMDRRVRRARESHDSAARPPDTHPPSACTGQVAELQCLTSLCHTYTAHSRLRVADAGEKCSLRIETVSGNVVRDSRIKLTCLAPRSCVMRLP